MLNTRSIENRLLPEVAWYMDLGARGKRVWKDCPSQLKSDISKFLDCGYVILKGSVPANLVEAARSEFFAHKAKYHDIYARYADANGFQKRVVNLHMALDSFKNLFALNEKALAIQDYLFGTNSVCFTSLTFESGSEQPIHRDSPYFCTNPEYYYFGVWVALEEVDEVNGALEVVEGGHLIQEPDRFSIIDKYYQDGEVINKMDARLWDDYQSETLRLCDLRKLERKIVPMSPGDTLIWHPHLPHGGSAIRDKTRSRLSVVNHVIPNGVPVSGMDVFFQRVMPPASVNYVYVEHSGRSFLRHEYVDFSHRDPIPFGEFLL